MEARRHKVKETKAKSTRSDAGKDPKQAGQEFDSLKHRVRENVPRRMNDLFFLL